MEFDLKLEILSLLAKQVRERGNTIVYELNQLSEQIEDLYQRMEVVKQSLHVDYNKDFSGSQENNK